MSGVIISLPVVHQHELMRARIADELSLVAEHIRRGEVEHDPEGWVLVLKSSAGFEVLHVNFSPAERMRAIADIKESAR